MLQQNRVDVAHYAPWPLGTPVAAKERQSLMCEAPHIVSVHIPVCKQALPRRQRQRVAYSLTFFTPITAPTPYTIAAPKEQVIKVAIPNADPARR